MPETCDGIDNSCGGVVDESFNVGDACIVGQGECQRQGTSICSANDCDDADASLHSGTIWYVDNNCDGVVDECCGSTQDVCALP